MDFLICAYGEPSEEKFIPYVQGCVQGFELQNYDRTGVCSPEKWHEVLEQHRSIIPKLPGRLAIHGPFAGIEYGYKDHLLREAVQKRMDMTGGMVRELRPDTLILHTGCPELMIKFNLTDAWLEQAAEFWKQEIKGYAEAGVRVVLENVVEQSPEAMIELVDRVRSDYLGLCFDIGHANLCSQLKPARWVELMGRRLKHVHLHDNSGRKDEHLPAGKGNIDFDSFFEALYAFVPEVTVSLEVLAAPEAVVENAIAITRRYGTKK